MTTKNYESLDEAMTISASAGIIRISFLVDIGKWSQLNLCTEVAKDLVSRLRRTIEAAELLARLDKEGR